VDGTNSVVVINSTVEKVKSKVTDFAFDSGPEILTAVLIIIAGFIIVRWFGPARDRSLRAALPCPYRRDSHQPSAEAPSELPRAA